MQNADKHVNDTGELQTLGDSTKEIEYIFCFTLFGKYTIRDKEMNKTFE